VPCLLSPFNSVSQSFIFFHNCASFSEYYSWCFVKCSSPDIFLMIYE
jgi:hypothetical protein